MQLEVVVQLIDMVEIFSSRCLERVRINLMHENFTYLQMWTGSDLVEDSLGVAVIQVSE